MKGLLIATFAVSACAVQPAFVVGGASDQLAHVDTSAAQALVSVFSPTAPQRSPASP